MPDAEAVFGKIIGEAVAKQLDATERKQLVDEVGRWLTRHDGKGPHDPLSRALAKALEEYTEQYCKQWLAANPKLLSAIDEKLGRVLKLALEKKLGKDLEERLIAKMVQALTGVDW